MKQTYYKSIVILLLTWAGCSMPVYVSGQVSAWDRTRTTGKNIFNYRPGEEKNPAVKKDRSNLIVYSDRNGNQAIQQCEVNYQTISGEVPANSQHSIVQDSIVQDSINNNCAKSGRPQDVDEIGNMFNEYCPSLGKAPKSDEMSDSVRKKLINCLLSPLTIDNYKKLFIDAENESDELKKRTEEKQYSSDFELVLDILQELGKKLQNKATA